jgi:hypothetical protein
MAVALRQAGVRFVIVGGYSARVQTSGWLTDDLDICYALDEANLRTLAGLMREWGAMYREREPGASAAVVLDESALRDSTILNLETSKGYIDLLGRVAGVGSYDACHAVAVEYEIAGVPLALLDVPSLVEAKRAADRPKDHAHIHILEASAALMSPEYADGVPSGLYHRLREEMGERLSKEDALTVTIGAFARTENLERRRLLSRGDPAEVAAIDRELASLPDKHKLAMEARDLANAAQSKVHLLSAGETARLRRAVEVARRLQRGPRRGPH